LEYRQEAIRRGIHSLESLKDRLEFAVPAAEGPDAVGAVDRTPTLEHIGSSQPTYDVALSFAGEDRDYVEAVAEALKGRLRVFYDKFETVELWGKDLNDHVDYVYRHASRYCVIFASADYETKAWTNHERRSAQAKAIEANEEYVLPVRFDDTNIPGVRPTVGYIDANVVTPQELADMIVEKVGPTLEEGGPTSPPPATQAVGRIIDAAGSNPSAAFKELCDQIELELRQLLAQSGSGEGGVDFNLADGVERLIDKGVLGRGMASNFGLLIHQREQVLAGATGADDTRSAVDLGLVLLKALQAVPREVNVVDHPGVDVFEDDECQRKYADVRGLILETISPGATSSSRRIFPTTHEYPRGKVVTWEWNSARQWASAWYREPGTGAVEYAWGGALEFAGRNLEDIAASGDWGSPDVLLGR
jgi:TIR domain